MKKYFTKFRNELTGLFMLVSCVANSQIITTVAGTGAGGYTGDSLQAIVSRLDLSEGGMAVDLQGNLYIPDYGNNRVRKLEAATGKLINVAGTGVNGYSGDGGPATAAKLYGPQAVAVDKAGNIYIADYSNTRIRRVDAITGIITTFAGTGVYNYNGDGILAVNADITSPVGIAVDTAGNVYFSHFGHRVRRVDKVTGIITTAVGTGTAGYNGDGIPANTAKLNDPFGLAFDKFNNLYIAEKSGYRIRKVSSATGNISTVAGNGVYGNGGDGGSATSASIKDAWDVEADSLGNVYIADRYDNKVRMVNTSGVINTIAGTTLAGYNGDGILGTTAELNNPSGVCLDKCGGLYINDRANNRIRKLGSFSFSATTSNVNCFGACTGTINANASGGAAPYTYTWTGGLGTGSSYTNVCAGNYIGNCTDNNGCKEQLNITITEPSQFLIPSSTQTNVTCNSNGRAIVSLSGGSGGPYIYSWTNGVTTSTATIPNNLTPGIYTVNVTNAAGCVATKTLNIAFTPTLGLTINTIDASCGSLGSATATATGAGPISYSWSTGSTTTTINSLTAGNYSVGVIDANGCSLTKTCSISVVTPTFASAPVCMVTVDSLSKYNVIMWDKTPFANVDSFIVYREITTNNYQRIVAQHRSVLSQFIDTVKSKYFPNTGDPNIGTYRYKLMMRDTCGNYSQLSLYHNTIWITHTAGTFSWPQLYDIEGAPNPVTGYVLWRDNLSNGNWQAIGSVAGTQQFIVDPNYNTYAATASWRIKTQWAVNCVPSKQQTSSSPSKSNVITNNQIGIKENSIDNFVSVSPNPSNGKFIVNYTSIDLNNLKVTLEIYNMTGEKIYSNRPESIDQFTIDLRDRSNGIYFLVLKTEKQMFSRKLVLQQ